MKSPMAEACLQTALNKILKQSREMICDVPINFNATLPKFPSLKYLRLQIGRNQNNSRAPSRALNYKNLNNNADNQ